MAADRLAAELWTRHDRFSSVAGLQGGEFVQRSALLFSSRSGDGHGGPARCVQTAVEVLAADPSLRGVMQALGSAIGAAQPAACPPMRFAGPMNICPTR